MKTGSLLSALLCSALAIAIGSAAVAVAYAQTALQPAQSPTVRNPAPPAPAVTPSGPTQRFQPQNPSSRLVPVQAEGPAATTPSTPAVQPMPPVETQSPPPVGAEPVPNTLNMVRTAQEQIGQVPSQFMWVRDGLMAARDPLDGAIVFFGDDGHVLGRARLPNGFDVEDIVGQSAAIRLIDSSHRTQITIQRNIDPATTPQLQSTANGSDPTVRARRLTRRGAQELIINDERQNGSAPLTVRSVAGGQLAQAYEISPGSGDYRYVVTEEIVAVRPALTVRVLVQRFDKDGKLTGVAYVPLDDFDAVPRNFITVTAQGQVRILAPLRDRIVIREMEMSAPLRGRQSPDHLKSLGRTLREIRVDANIIGGANIPFRNIDVPNVKLAVAVPPITRSKVLENARAYLTINWVMQPGNYSHPTTENVCDPVRGKLWLRPRHFTPDLIGTTIGPMPYRWGGGDTPESFRLSIEWGALAGDLCTCRDAALNYCLFPQSAGVDCSGFISRAWGIEKRGTSGLMDVADEVKSIADLKAGDAFNWPQRHVRLFIGMAPGTATAFNILESSTRLECEGVCERTVRPSEVDGYRLIRYRGIGDTAVIADGAAVSPSPVIAGENGRQKRVNRNSRSVNQGLGKKGPAEKRVGTKGPGSQGVANRPAATNRAMEAQRR